MAVNQIVPFGSETQKKRAGFLGQATQNWANNLSSTSSGPRIMFRSGTTPQSVDSATSASAQGTSGQSGGYPEEVPETSRKPIGMRPASQGSERNIRPNTSTSVEDQLNSLTDSNSGYMQRAATRGMQVANARGLANSSIASGASQAAALDAALPIAQEDAAFYQNKALDANKYAQERAVKQWEQENLAYSQFIKGVADINIQDMSKTAKDQAIAKLWKMYQASRPVSSSLANIQIIDGRIVRNAPRQTSGGGSSGSAVGNAPGPNAGSGAASSGNRSYFQFNSIKDMPQWVQDSYRQRYGNVEPQKARQIAEVLAYAKEKYKDAIRGAPDGKTYGRDYAGAQFGSAGAKKSFQQFVLNELKKVGITPHNEEINTVAAGPEYSKNYYSQYHAASQFGS